MRLDAWLKKANMNQRNFADWMKVPQPSVSMWITGRRKPTPAQIAEIDRRTGGEVTFYDFYDVPRRRPRRAAEHKPDVLAFDHFSFPLPITIRRTASPQ